MFRIVCLLIGYFIGCIETAYFVSKLWKTDLRQHGSGNLGMTNAMRVLGRKAGVITFVGDICKAVLAFVICYRIFFQVGPMAGVYGGIGAILGHDFPFYLRFRGGKGISSTIGMALCIAITMEPRLAIPAILLGVGAVVLTKTISAGSLMLSLTIPVSLYLFGQPTELVALTAATCVLAFWKHRANIHRLLTGTENKFTFGKK